MNPFLFGFDSEHPEQCAQLLQDHGIQAVVMGNPTHEAAHALEQRGIELYLCFGAHALRSGGAWAMDAGETARRWFHSGCPNDEQNAGSHLRAVLERARRFPTARGILVDGARFASFASSEGFDSFFTCFCPRCMQLMEQDGLDARAIRQAVETLARERRLEEEKPLSAWLGFRERCVQRYMDDFAKAVHSLRPDFLAGAFVFAPSLSAFVGQTASACRSLDIVSPMLYRAYPHKEGPACLGHEWAAFLSGFGQAASAVQKLNAHVLPLERSPHELLTHGFAPERIGEETALARSSLLPGQQLWPILQIEDAYIRAAAHQANSHGADRIGYFAYGLAELPPA